eukprot:TRINITY_DN9495_c0_g1_i1.p1 TRINITY_DN9495_c0_g1~~TRINITY_DN9495_c0_g1_i1.p1  ORF type:complete len:603 (+),score=54.07 TRINITY_DN9495_c0_g1_i1:27-1811(+)
MRTIYLPQVSYPVRFFAPLPLHAVSPTHSEEWSSSSGYMSDETSLSSRGATPDKMFQEAAVQTMRKQSKSVKSVRDSPLVVKNQDFIIFDPYLVLQFEASERDVITNQMDDEWQLLRMVATVEIARILDSMGKSLLLKEASSRNELTIAAWQGFVDCTVDWAAQAMHIAHMAIGWSGYLFKTVANLEEECRNRLIREEQQCQINLFELIAREILVLNCTHEKTPLILSALQFQEGQSRVNVMHNQRFQFAQLQALEIQNLEPILRQSVAQTENVVWQAMYMKNTYDLSQRQLKSTKISQVQLSESYDRYNIAVDFATSAPSFKPPPRPKLRSTSVQATPVLRIDSTTTQTDPMRVPTDPATAITEELLHREIMELAALKTVAELKVSECQQRPVLLPKPPTPRSEPARAMRSVSIMADLYTASTQTASQSTQVSITTPDWAPHPPQMTDLNGWLGARVRPRSIFLPGGPMNGLMPVDGCEIVSTAALRTPAGLAGLRPGDVILSIDNRSVTTTESFSTSIRAMTPGTLSQVVVYTPGEGIRRLQVRSGGMPPRPTLATPPRAVPAAGPRRRPGPRLYPFHHTNQLPYYHSGYGV